MNVTIPHKEKMKKKTIFIYISIVILCILAIIVVVSMQILGKDMTSQIFGVYSLQGKSKEEEELLKTNFDQIFQNSFQGNVQQNTFSKINPTKEIVYTGFHGQKKENNQYEIKVSIPYLNIEDEVIQKYNEEISKTFKDKVYSILKEKNQNIIYTVEYQASVENSILSVIIRSNLKQGSSAQRVIVQTYHFDLEKQKEITLSDVLEKFNLDDKKVEEKVRQEIKKEQKKAEDLQELGYTIYTRNSESDVYTIENTKQFFIHQNNLYIIYAYGNDSITSEMDLIIL